MQDNSKPACLVAIIMGNYRARVSTFMQNDLKELKNVRQTFITSFRWTNSQTKSKEGHIRVLRPNMQRWADVWNYS